MDFSRRGSIGMNDRHIHRTEGYWTESPEVFEVRERKESREDV